MLFHFLIISNRLVKVFQDFDKKKIAIENLTFNTPKYCELKKSNLTILNDIEIQNLLKYYKSWTLLIIIPKQQIQSCYKNQQKAVNIFRAKF